MNGPTADGHRRPDQVKNAVKGSAGQILGRGPGVGWLILKGTILPNEAIGYREEDYAR